MGNFKENRYIAQELKDWELYKKWAERYFGAYVQLMVAYPQKYGSIADVRLVDENTKKERVVELKQRNPKAASYSDCFIEMGK